MRDLTAEVERLLAEGQAAATNLRGGDLDRITTELTRIHAELDKQALSKEQLERVRSQLGRFRDLCRFIHDTLGHALHGDASYERGGVQAGTDRRPLLVEKYG